MLKRHAEEVAVVVAKLQLERLGLVRGSRSRCDVSRLVLHTTSLRKHLKTTYLKERRHKCRFCETTFSRSDYLACHEGSDFYYFYYYFITSLKIPPKNLKTRLIVCPTNIVEISQSDWFIWGCLCLYWNPSQCSLPTLAKNLSLVSLPIFRLIFLGMCSLTSDFTKIIPDDLEAYGLSLCINSQHLTLWLFAENTFLLMENFFK